MLKAGLIYHNWSCRSLVAGLGLWFGTAIAADAPDQQALLLSEQREQFVHAELRIGSTNRTQAEQWLTELADYPLQPYLEQRWLEGRLDSTERIEQFLQRYQGTPMDWPLRKRWLLYLAQRKAAELFLANYRPTQDAELQCHALRFRLEKEPAERIWPEVRELWTVGVSQPRACDPLFARWRDAGKMTPEVIWQRVGEVADGGQAGLLPYLRGLLPSSEQYLVDLWIRARRNPAVVAQRSFFPGRDQRERQILAYGLRRMVWRDPDLALRTWQRHETDPHFTESQREVVIRAFAVALASKGDERTIEWMEQVPTAHMDDTLAHWRVAHALHQQDWPLVQRMIETMPAELQQSAAWQYWLARSLEQQGATDSADVLWRQLAQQRNYYGFMAASRLGLPPSLSHRPVPVTDLEVTELASHPTVHRAQEWLALGRMTEARREWNHLQRVADEQTKMASARLAAQMQWYERSIFSLADVGFWDDIELRFPLAFKDEMTEYAGKAEVDTAWAMAITRRESSFMVDANSPVGARGLMQIMPNTANYIAKQPVQLGQLYNPITNISYGTDYLNYLMRRNDGNLIVATASYNAGYSRVRQWIPRDRAMPADIWIDTIPFRETREYVKAVLAYYQIYNIRMDNPVDVFAPLHSMQIGQLDE
ncbi:transglycosylase SLT domain-containing protein [Alkalimonas collagenimarina]|uniref:Transglycosylase SLT domain-containing protein n=1 Tax=Alkalimonas collagenimarina TaxID=400390 RepID=A0ABT9H1H3_9GAMM|nr:transglycosylase SLT domain-containing protein [Alkalimonas collagenimarina]MDP4537169.1 transglycosylase SLT domain-containing protein [Alkalimonas collagenimarina]